MATKKEPAKEPENATLDTGDRKPLETLGGLKEERENEISQGAEGNAQGTKTGKKRGPYNKRKKSEPEPAAPMESPIEAEAIAGFVQLVFGMLAQKTGLAHWNVTQDEATRLSEATDAMINKYLPTLANYMVELNFGLALCSVVGMRMFLTYQMNEAKKQAALENGPKNAAA